MAISFVGSAEAFAVNGNDATITLPAMQQDDLVIVAYSIGDSDNVDFNMAMVTAGYTEVADLFADDTGDCNFGVFWKVMGATPDTTAVVDGQGGANAAVAAVAMVFRGVNTTTPMDVTPTTATGINTMHPNPPSIDHLNPAGVWTVIAGASVHNLGGSGTYTFPTGYVTNAIDVGANDTNDATTGMGYRTNPADPEDPGVMTHSGTDSASFAWAAVTMALRPVAATPTRGRISFAETEVPFVPTRGRVSFAEMEAPFVPTRGRVSFVEMEAPFAATRGRMSWAEMEVPSVGPEPTRGRISFAEFEAPLVPTRGRMSWAELETPVAPTRGRISWAEMAAPSVGGDGDQLYHHRGIVTRQATLKTRGYGTGGRR